MKIKSPGAFLLYAVSLFFLVSCEPFVSIPTETRIPIPSEASTPSPISLTATPIPSPVLFTEAPACPSEHGPCPGSSLTPPTVIPIVGDLGWGSVYGRLTDGITNLPIAGAIVRCEQFSYRSPLPCMGSTTTDADGKYTFAPVFFHDTDRIILAVEAPGYEPLRLEKSFFTQPYFHTDLVLLPAGSDTSAQTATPTSTP